MPGRRSARGPPMAYRTSASTASRCDSSSASLERVCSTTSAGARATNDSLASLRPVAADLAIQVGEGLPVLGQLGLAVDQSGQGQDDLGLGQHGHGAFGRAVEVASGPTICTDSAGERLRRYRSPCCSIRQARPLPATMIGSTLASLGTFRSARRLRIALIASHHCSTVLVAVLVGPAHRPGPGRDADTLLGGRGAFQTPHGCQGRQTLPDLLGHERHNRVQQPAKAVEQRAPARAGPSDAFRGRGGGPWRTPRTSRRSRPR